MYHNISASKKMSYIALYKRFTSRKTYAAVAITYSLIVLTGSVIFRSVFLAENRLSLQNYSVWWDDVFSVLTLFITLIAFLSDFLFLNGKFIFRHCKWYEYFIGQDPLRFRVEVIFIILGIIIGIIQSIFVLVKDPYHQPVLWAVLFVILYLFRIIVWCAAFGGVICIYALMDAIVQRRKYDVSYQGNMMN